MSFPIRKLFVPSETGIRKTIIVGSVEDGDTGLYAYRLPVDRYSAVGPLLVVGTADMHDGLVTLGSSIVASDDETEPGEIPDHGSALLVPPSTLYRLLDEWPTLTFLSVDFAFESDQVPRSPETGEPVDESADGSEQTLTYLAE